MIEKVCGIYGIERLADKAIYVGQSINCRARFNQHKHHLRRRKHANKHLQNAYNLYGEDSFRFFILEKCDTSSLDDKEQYYLDMMKKEQKVVFNCGEVAACPNRGRKLKPLTDEHKAKIAASVRGYKKSPEECRAISERKKGLITSDETKKKQSIAKKGKKQTKQHALNSAIARTGIKRNIKQESINKLIERNKSMVFTDEIRQKMREASTGKLHSDETKEKCRQASLKYWAARKAIGDHNV